MIPTMPFIEDQESFQENSTMLQDVDEDEADETLSLCDLEIYSDSATSQANDISSSSSSSSLSSEPEVFEFFSEEFNSNSSLTTFLPTSTPPNNIIFCGKIIAYRQPISPKTHKKKRGLFRWKTHKKKRGLFRWNSDERMFESNTIPSTPPRSKSMEVPKKYLPERASIFQSPTKSRWYLFFFGMGGFPRKMELSDIRSRQVRRSPSTMFRVENGGDEAEAVGGSAGMKLIRALGCGGVGNNQTKVVGKAATVGCFGGVRLSNVVGLVA